MALSRFRLGFLMFVLIGLLCIPQAAQAGQTVKQYTLLKGTRYETTYYVIKSDTPGPVLMVTAGIHGNERSPMEAADQIRKWTIDKGTLIVVPECNQPAIKANKRESSDGDLNRLFKKTAKGKSGSSLATALLNLVSEHKVEWLIDLHEGYDYSKKSSSVGQSIIYMPGTKGSEAFAKKLQPILNKSISKSNERFQLLKYPVKGSLARSAADLYKVRSIIFETCTKDTKAERIAFEREAVVQVMKYIGMKK